MPTWKIAAVQIDCQLGDRSANLSVMRDRLDKAGGAGARLVVFPECVLAGYSFESKEEARPFAETIPGPATEEIGGLCRRLGVWAVFGLLECEGDRLFNACALVGPAGQVASYRKVHLPCLGVDRFTTPGDRPFAVHDLGGLRVGMNICYDGSFPEASRALALLGADLIVLPTNWPEGGRRSMQYLAPARALENHVYYAAVNRVGTERGFAFIGCSRILDVNGDILAASHDDRETILIAEIDPERSRRKRIVNIPGKYEVDRVADRRPEMYGPVCER